MCSAAALAAVVAVAASSIGRAAALSHTEAGCAVLGANAEVLDCSAKQTGGRLSSIPTDIPNSVIHLWLSGNQIGAVGATDLAGLTNLRYLYLDNNLITVIAPGAFDDLGSLVFLLLNHNALTTIPDGALAPMHHLEALDLRNNALSHVSPGSFSGLANLTYLNLFGNSVSRIGCGTFNAVPALGYVNLGDNPSQCEVTARDTGVLWCSCSHGVTTGGLGYCSAETECPAGAPVLEGYVKGESTTPVPPSAGDSLVPLDEARFSTLPPAETTVGATTPGADANAGSATVSAGGDDGTGLMLAGLIGGMAVMVAAVGVAINARAHSKSLLPHHAYKLASSVSTSSPPTMTSYDSATRSRRGGGGVGVGMAAVEDSSQVDLTWDDANAGAAGILSWTAGEDATSECDRSETSSMSTSIMNRTMDEAKWRGSMWNAGGRALRPEPVSRSTLSHYSSGATLPR